MPIDRRKLRAARLTSEYGELMKLNGNIIKIEPLGTAPYSKYRITFYIRTIIHPMPMYQNKTVCILELPENFPIAMPRLHIDENSGTKHPWHVNWYTGGTWCAGNWHCEEPLTNYVYRCAKTLQFDSQVTNPFSPANELASPFWNANKGNPSVIPCDKQVLPTLDVPARPPRIQFLDKPKPKITFK